MCPNGWCGYNSFPRGIRDDVPERLVRPTKYLWIEHAERNAICNAARAGTATEGCTIYVNIMPCMDCARAVVQAGIVQVVISAERMTQYSSDYYNEHFGMVEVLFREAKVGVRRVWGCWSRTDSSVSACAAPACASGSVPAVSACTSASAAAGAATCRWKRRSHPRQRNGALPNAIINESSSPRGRECRMSAPPQLGHRILSCTLTRSLPLTVRLTPFGEMLLYPGHTLSKSAGSPNLTPSSAGSMLRSNPVSTPPTPTST